ncbi:hypothetical protein [Beihai hepe-like virus 8]|uniref:hypothetical protein n=1 Tax=Beihai hepe-like virus 8 TaxID=1922385 RepID=UPI00090BB1F1|nr:hypothetical protein [Beihai hepe-like virus 8]APG77601.1 hypothetical protein [Beihai hepe-like virus 8]
MKFIILFIPCVFAVNTVRLVDSQFDEIIKTLVNVSTSINKDVTDSTTSITKTIVDRIASLTTTLESSFSEINHNIAVLGDYFELLRPSLEAMNNEITNGFKNVQNGIDDINSKVVEDYQASNCTYGNPGYPFLRYGLCYPYRIMEGNDLYLRMTTQGFAGPYMHHGILPFIFNNISSSIKEDFYYKFIYANSILKWYGVNTDCTFLQHLYNIGLAQAHVFRQTGCASEVSHVYSGGYLTVIVRVLDQPITQIKHSDISDMYQLMMAHFDKSIYVNMEDTQRSYRFAADSAPFLDYLIARRSVFSICNSSPFHNCSAGSPNPRFSRITHLNPTQAKFEYPLTRPCYPFGRTATKFTVTMPDSYLTVLAFQDDKLKYETLSLSLMCPEAIREVTDDQDPANVIHKYEYTVNSKPVFVDVGLSNFIRLNVHRRFYPLAVVFHHPNGTTQPWLTTMYNSDPNYFDFTPRCVKSRNTVHEIFYELERGRSVDGIWDCGFPDIISSAPSNPLKMNVTKLPFSSGNAYPYYLSALKNDFAIAVHEVEPNYFNTQGFSIFNDSRNAVKLRSIGVAWFSVVGDSSANPGYIYKTNDQKPSTDPNLDDFKTVVPAVRRVRSAVAVVNDAINNFKSAFDTIAEVKKTAEDVWAKVDAGLAILGDVWMVAKKFIV